jgi:hypothetical protein
MSNKMKEKRVSAHDCFERKGDRVGKDISLLGSGKVTAFIVFCTPSCTICLYINDQGKIVRGTSGKAYIVTKIPLKPTKRSIEDIIDQAIKKKLKIYANFCVPTATYYCDGVLSLLKSLKIDESEIQKVIKPVPIYKEVKKLCGLTYSEYKHIYLDRDSTSHLQS